MPEILYRLEYEYKCPVCGKGDPWCFDRLRENDIINEFMYCDCGQQWRNVYEFHFTEYEVKKEVKYDGAN